MEQIDISIEDVFKAHPNKTAETEHLTKTEIKDIQKIFNNRLQSLLNEVVDEYLEDCKNLARRK